MMRAVDPSQDPSVVPESELQRWAEAFWPGPNPQNQFPQMMTGTNRKMESNHQTLFLCMILFIRHVKEYV